MSNYGNAEAAQFLLSANLTAFESKDYDAAYHFLAAALHHAQAYCAFDRLTLIGETARQQSTSIDENSPDYHHSTISAATRGHENIFRRLASQADTASSMVKAKAARAKLE